jgi:hypothetical protein
MRSRKLRVLATKSKWQVCVCEKLNPFSSFFVTLDAVGLFVF